MFEVFAVVALWCGVQSDGSGGKTQTEVSACREKILKCLEKPPSFEKCGVWHAPGECASIGKECDPLKKGFWEYIPGCRDAAAQDACFRKTK